MPQNPVIWFEIYVQDMPRARRFYETVLGRSLTKMPVDGLEMWSFADVPQAEGSAGALVQSPPGMASGGNSTIVYFACADCAVEAGRVAAAGGKLVRPKMSIGPFGFVALAEDPDGNYLGLHSMT